MGIAHVRQCIALAVPVTDLLRDRPRLFKEGKGTFGLTEAMTGVSQFIQENLLESLVTEPLRHCQGRLVKRKGLFA